MKIHRFECTNKHIFFIPLNLPQELMILSEAMQKMKCPLCDCKEINISANEFVVH